MKKMIIPRRDHEVYFIKRPENIKTKMLRPFVIEQLDRLHPGFSASSCVDIQKCAFNGTRWIMATVMEAETLAEYRILHKNTAFYTNTSITVHKKEFLRCGINIMGDERIGIDTEKNEPVSVPLEADKGSNLPNMPSDLKTIPLKHGVFGKKTVRRNIAAIAACAAFLCLFLTVFNSSRKESNGAVFIEAMPEPAAELKYLPQAIEILANISADLVEAGGKMESWQYNEDLDPFLIIRMKGIDVLAAHTIFAHYDYFLPQEIREVLYNGGEPYLTVNVNVKRAGYAQNAAGIFPSQGFILPVIAELAGDLLRRGISIASEVLPAAAAGSNFYTVTYTANDRDLIQSLDIITSYCDKYALRIKRMDISITSDNNRFNVICSLAQCGISSQMYTLTGNKKEKIPAAFGYRESAPAAVEMTTTPETSPQTPVLGTIRDRSGNMLFYRDTNDGKIKVRGNI